MRPFKTKNIQIFGYLDIWMFSLMCKHANMQTCKLFIRMRTESIPAKSLDEC